MDDGRIVGATTTDELKHYGVIGMKWGVRRGRASQAYQKATAKKKKLESKAEKFEAKAKKMDDKLTRRKIKYVTSIGEALYKKKSIKSANYKRKARKYRNKGERWAKQMEAAFKDVSLSELRKG